MRFGRLITAFLSILAIACSSDGEDIPPTPEPDTIMLDSNLFTVDAKGGEAHITFRANKDWTIRYADDQQAVFGTLDAEKGDADDHCRIVFTMHPNTSTDRRNVVFNLTAGHAAAQVTVSQEGLGIELPTEEEVRTYLMRLYNDNDGPNWRFNHNWGSDLPINRWNGVLYENGRLDLRLGELEVKGKVDLSGCRALVELHASKNEITEVDLSDCPMLEEVYLINNKISKIKVDGCLSLRKLDVGYNEIENLSVGWCTTLDELSFEYNRLESIDLSRCVELQEIDCAVNQMKSLVIPHRQKLRHVFCYENSIKELDLSGAPYLSIISCFNNDMKSLTFDNNGRLYIFWCFGNRIGGEIPEWMDKISQFEHDARYEYPDDGSTPYIDNDSGWWYPGEPASGHHAR